MGAKSDLSADEEVVWDTGKELHLLQSLIGSVPSYLPPHLYKSDQVLIKLSKNRECHLSFICTVEP